jgi:hypothetical protein
MWQELRGKIIIFYNVRVLGHFWSPVVPCYATWDAVRIVNSFIYNLTHVTTITHNYFLLCVTFTQLTIIHVHNYNNLLHSYTGWLLSYQLLSQIITYCRTRKVFNSHCEPTAISSSYNFRRDLTTSIHFLRLTHRHSSSSIVRASLQQRAGWELCCVTRGNAKITRYFPTPVAGWRHRGMLRRNRMPILLRDVIASARKSCLPAGA